MSPITASSFRGRFHGFTTALNFCLPVFLFSLSSIGYSLFAGLDTLSHVLEILTSIYLLHGSTFLLTPSPNKIQAHQRPCIKYVGGGAKSFKKVVKYFRHISMGDEIFSKIFDGLQNIFLCSIFVILFFTLRGLEHKISRLAIKEMQERHNILNKSHTRSRYQANSGKIKNILMHFDPDARTFVLSN